jgi:hypothetical protein
MRSIIANLTPTIEASGPHDFAVHEPALRQQRRPHPPHPLPYVRDDRETPLCVGRDGKRYEVIWVRWEAKISEIQK